MYPAVPVTCLNSHQEPVSRNFFPMQSRAWHTCWEEKMSHHSAVQHRAGHAVVVSQGKTSYFIGYNQPCQMELRAISPRDWANHSSPISTSGLSTQQSPSWLLLCLAVLFCSPPFPQITNYPIALLSNPCPVLKAQLACIARLTVAVNS